MRIFVFEYITGGGLSHDKLPSSLLWEGKRMLEQLIGQLNTLAFVSCTTLLDYRLADLAIECETILTVLANESYINKFRQQLEHCDAVWLIAPEFDCILQNLCELVSHRKVLLLNASPEAVAISGDKYRCYQHLRQHNIPTVNTYCVDELPSSPVIGSTREWVIKPRDGAGCERTYVFDCWSDVVKKLDTEHILQPHIQGIKSSLSCLFGYGQAWVICANEQHFEIKDNAYCMQGITINSRPVSAADCQLAMQLASAIPGLWGYIGIDLIEENQIIQVLEINPRLTTSFIAIAQVTGISVAEEVIRLVKGELPRIAHQQYQTLFVNFYG